MAPKSLASTTFLLVINLLIFAFVSSTKAPCAPTTPKIPSQGHGHSQPAVPACPRDALKLGACANLLGDLVHLVIGTPPTTTCCSLLAGLADVEAAACLCTAIKANVLGINLNVPVSLSLLLNYCGMKVPYGFKCT